MKLVIFLESVERIQGRTVNGEVFGGVLVEDTRVFLDLEMFSRILLVLFSLTFRHLLGALVIGGDEVRCEDLLGRRKRFNDILD